MWQSTKCEIFGCSQEGKALRWWVVYSSSYNMYLTMRSCTLFQLAFINNALYIDFPEYPVWRHCVIWSMILAAMLVFYSDSEIKNQLDVRPEIVKEENKFKECNERNSDREPWTMEHDCRSRLGLRHNEFVICQSCHRCASDSEEIYSVTHALAHNRPITCSHNTMRRKLKFLIVKLLKTNDYTDFVQGGLL